MFSETEPDRSDLSNFSPIHQQYRVKIDGLPLSMTAMELLSELKRAPVNLLNSIETPEIPDNATVRHFYLVRQQAEKLARKRVFEWHNYPIRQNYVVKCQLEYDRASYVVKLQTDNQQLRTVFALNGNLPAGTEASRGMPPGWVRTDRLLGRSTGDVYVVYPASSTDDRLGVMKLYRAQNDLDLQRARRELLALRRLAHEPSVVAVYHSNILDAPLWIITQLVSELTLEDFVRQQPSEMDLSTVLSLTRQLLDIVHRCHEAGVYHRNLHPSNVMIHRSGGETKLVLIDFSLAWIDDGDPEMCDSPTIDATSICYILFWLLTDEWFDRTCTIDSPHRDPEYQSKIIEKLGTIVRESSVELREQLMLVFDRAFGSSDHHWSIDDLIHQITTIDSLLASVNVTPLDALFPLAATMRAGITPLTDPYARAVTLIARGKQQFVQQYPSLVRWSDTHNHWSTTNNGAEVRNLDELIYDYQGRRITLSIECLAKIDHDQIALSLGTGSVDGTTELTPLGTLTEATFDTEVEQHFQTAIKKLIVARILFI